MPRDRFPSDASRTLVWTCPVTGRRRYRYTWPDGFWLESTEGAKK